MKFLPHSAVAPSGILILILILNSHRHFSTIVSPASPPSEAGVSLLLVSPYGQPLFMSAFKYALLLMVNMLDLGLKRLYGSFGVLAIDVVATGACLL